MSSISLDQIKEFTDVIHNLLINSNVFFVRDSVTLKMNGLDIDAFIEYDSGEYVFITKKGQEYTAYDFVDTGCNIELETHFCRTELNNPMYNMIIYDFAFNLFGAKFTNWIFKNFNLKYFYFRYFSFFILVP